MMDPCYAVAKERQQAILDWADRRRLLKQASLDCKPCRRVVRWVAGRMSAFHIQIPGEKRLARLRPGR